MGQFPTDVIVAKTTPYAPYLVSNATLYENAFGGQVVDVQAIVNPQPGPIWCAWDYTLFSNAASTTVSVGLLSFFLAGKLQIAYDFYTQGLSDSGNQLFGNQAALYIENSDAAASGLAAYPWQVPMIQFNYFDSLNTYKYSTVARAFRIGFPCDRIVLSGNTDGHGLDAYDFGVALCSFSI